MTTNVTWLNHKWVLSGWRDHVIPLTCARRVSVNAVLTGKPYSRSWPQSYILVLYNKAACTGLRLLFNSGKFFFKNMANQTKPVLPGVYSL